MSRITALLAALAISFFVFAPALAPAFAAGGGGEGEHSAVPEAHVNWTNFFDYKEKDVNGGTLEPGEEHMAPPLLFQFLNFAIFLGILIVVAGPRIKKAMRKNHDNVKTALEEAATMKAEAAAKLDEYTARIAKVDKEVDELVATIKADAEAERARIVADAEAQSAALKRNAEDRITASIGRARADLEAEVVAAAVAAAEKVLTKQVEDSDQNNLVEQFIASIETDDSSSGPGGGGSGKPTPKTPPTTGPREKRESEVDEGWG